MSKICALVAAAAAFTFATAGVAQPNEVAVGYRDINLATPEGRATLNVRLQRAAEEVCSFHGTNDLAFRMAAQRCRAAALSDARQKADIVVAQAASNHQVAAK